MVDQHGPGDDKEPAQCRKIPVVPVAASVKPKENLLKDLVNFFGPGKSSAQVGVYSTRVPTIQCLECRIVTLGVSFEKLFVGLQS